MLDKLISEIYLFKKNKILIRKIESILKVHLNKMCKHIYINKNRKYNLKNKQIYIKILIISQIFLYINHIIIQ